MNCLTSTEAEVRRHLPTSNIRERPVTVRALALAGTRCAPGAHPGERPQGEAASLQKADSLSDVERLRAAERWVRLCALRLGRFTFLVLLGPGLRLEFNNQETICTFNITHLFFRQIWNNADSLKTFEEPFIFTLSISKRTFLFVLLMDRPNTKFTVAFSRRAAKTHSWSASSQFT